jgi:hypothetical protein
VPTLPKPSARRAITQILRTHMIAALRELDPRPSARSTSTDSSAQRRGRKPKTIHNLLAALSTLLGATVATLLAPDFACAESGLSSQDHGHQVPLIGRSLHRGWPTGVFATRRRQTRRIRDNIVATQTARARNPG